MLFALICLDKPGALAQRQAVRPAHLAYLDSRIGEIVRGGALLDAEGRPCGSLLIIDVADQAAAEAFAAADPFQREGVFGSVTAYPYRVAIADGARIA